MINLEHYFFGTHVTGFATPSSTRILILRINELIHDMMNDDPNMHDKVTHIHFDGDNIVKIVRNMMKYD